MQDHELYQRILGLTHPWKVTDIRMSLAERQVVVVASHVSNALFECPECHRACGIHDHRVKRWRHLPTCQLQTVIEASMPRVLCPEHGVHLVHVPWSEPGSGFTAMFEAMVIAWLGEATIKAVAKLVGLSWDQVDGISQRAIDRGLERRKPSIVKNMGIDETSYQDDHEYVSVITDRDRGIVLEVLEDRRKETVVKWLADLSDGQRQGMSTISMDMWDGFIGAFREQIPEADRKICFDRFHVASYFGKAVDKVRIPEQKLLKETAGDDRLTGTKHDWLRNSERTDNRSRVCFMSLTRSTLRTARAWAIKEQAGKLWGFTSRIWAEKGWRHLLGWIDRCRLKPVMKVGKMVKGHLWGIINAIVASATNAIGESLNARIQKIKSMACGYRNRDRFRRAILFRLGGLDLMPSGTGYPCHPIS